MCQQIENHLPTYIYLNDALCSCVCVGSKSFCKIYMHVFYFLFSINNSFSEKDKEVPLYRKQYAWSLRRGYSVAKAKRISRSHRTLGPMY